MNESSSTSQVARSHRSIRFFQNIKIDPLLIQELIECALRSSSSGNTQCWSIVTTEDPLQKEKLFVAHMQQPVVKEAPLLMTFVGDYHRMTQWLLARGAATSYDDLLGFLTCFTDAVIAAQTVALVAESKGLGICYLGTTIWNIEEIAKILELPDLTTPVITLAIGYPRENPELRDRLPLQCVHHRETYQKLSTANVLASYSEKEIKGWERYHQVPRLRQKIIDSKAQNLAQLYTSSFKNEKKKHIELSKKILNFLTKQGFWRF